MMTPKEKTELEQLRRDVDKILQMKGVSPVNVNWVNGTPIINPDPDQNIPIIISGYSSGMGMSGTGVYWWQEQDFDRTGSRVVKFPGLRGYVSASGSAAYSGTLASGLTNSSGYIAQSSGILSGIPVNPLYETNARVIASNQFPYYGWARRRAMTNVASGPGQTLGAAYEFDYGISGATGGGGGGISGINITGLLSGTTGAGEAGIRIVSGIVNLALDNMSVVSGPGLTASARIGPAFASLSGPGIIGNPSNIYSGGQYLGPAGIIRTPSNFVIGGSGGSPYLALQGSELGNQPPTNEANGLWSWAAAVDNNPYGGPLNTTTIYQQVLLHSGKLNGYPTSPQNNPLMAMALLPTADSGQALSVLRVMGPPESADYGFETAVELSGTRAYVSIAGGSGTCYRINTLFGATQDIIDGSGVLWSFVGGLFMGAF